jgi:RNA polymerase sigma-70 factor, ECF subfamily
MSWANGSVMAEPLTEQTWREVMAQLRAFVRRRIADPERADDIVGDILLRILRGLGSVDNRQRLAPWVSRVARNAVIDEYRRAGRRREQLVPATEDAAMYADDESSTVLAELAGCLRPLLAGLPPEQRRAVELVDLDGMLQADAARREDVSVSGMKSRVQRGRRRLAELLGQCCTLTFDARGLPMEYTPPPDGCGDGCGCVDPP